MSRVAFLPFVVDNGDEDWQELALCREVDPEVFYPERGESSVAARLICGRCPVRDACLEDALDAGEPYGFWGGKSTVERKQILRDRQKDCRMTTSDQPFCRSDNHHYDRSTVERVPLDCMNQVPR